MNSLDSRLKQYYQRQSLPEHKVDVLEQLHMNEKRQYESLYHIPYIYALAYLI